MFRHRAAGAIGSPNCTRSRVELVPSSYPTPTDPRGPKNLQAVFWGRSSGRTPLRPRHISVRCSTSILTSTPRLVNSSALVDIGSSISPTLIEMSRYPGRPSVSSGCTLVQNLLTKTISFRARVCKKDRVRFAHSVGSKNRPLEKMIARPRIFSCRSRNLRLRVRFF